ncbi:GNAT family N-acetyltransferase [Sphingomonas lutea]|uniref:GNAT family N-acetyltransferase n=2 Tax=Sphingomonas lutea TaxID=1045317 RepID=A0A7G9SKW0_9SPHN|nr:GNAT family N-acetyltransferase [Sphingomonas lutea]
MTAIERDAVNAVGTAAYAQFEGVYSDWARFYAGAANLAALDIEGQVLVARDHSGAILGAVGYFGPGTPRPECFAPNTAVIRMLAVAPKARGGGIGRALTDACIERAKADGAPTISLHTSPAMAVALAMYQRVGFREVRTLPDRFGVPYAVYQRELN